MTNIPIRFGQSQGLEATANVQTQAGLVELKNAALDLRDVIQKRDGSEQIALTTGAAADDVLDPIGLQTVAFRRDELLVWSDRDLYSRSRCSSADAVEPPVGVATDIQITQARSGAAAALRTRRSFQLAGHPDAGLVTTPGESRPLLRTATASGVTATIQRTSTGGIRASLTGTAGGFAVVDSSLVLFAGSGLGGTDVRIAYIGDFVFAGGGGVGPYFAAAWREGTGDSVTWTVLQPGLNSSGAVYAPQGTETVSTGNRPYDLLRADTVTDGLLATLIYAPSTSVVRARSRDTSFPFGTLLNRNVTLSPGVAVQPSDVIRGLAAAVSPGFQTAALFLRQASRNEYRPLRFDAAFTQTSIRTPPSDTAVAPAIARTTAGTAQIVGTFDAATGGLHVFTSSITTAPVYVATRAASSSAQIVAAHTGEIEQTATEWQLRRDGLGVLTVAQDGGVVRAVLARANVIVALVSRAPNLRRMVWQPASAGPTPAYVVVANTSGHLAAAQSANRVAYLYTAVESNRVQLLSSSDGVAFTSSPLEFLPSGESTLGAPGGLVITAETGLSTVDAEWFYVGNFAGTAKVARRAVQTADVVQGIPLTASSQASIGSLYVQDFGVFSLVVLNIQPSSGQSSVTYEFGADYVVQVDPRLVTLQAGNFQERGPWTTARLRQEVPIQTSGGGQVIACDVAEVQGCRVMLWQVSGGLAPGIYVAVVSDHLELVGGQVRVDALGTRPMVVANQADGSVLLTYLLAGVLQWARWTPSSTSISFASSGIAPVNNVYATLAVSTEIGVPANKYVVVARAASPAHRVVRVDASNLAIVFNETYNAGGTPNGDVLAVAIESSEDDSFILRGAHPGPLGVSTWRISLPDGGAGTLVTTSANSYTITPALVLRMAIASPDATSNYHLLIERSDHPSVELASNATTEPAALRRRWFQHTVWSTAIRLELGRVYAVLGGRGGFNRNASYFVLDLGSLEIVSRSFAEEGENSATQGARLIVGHLAVPSLELAEDRTRVLYAAAVQLRGSDITIDKTLAQGISDLTSVGIASVMFDMAPFSPAELDGVLVHAHAGYPRSYSGDLPHEHDFHSWPVPTGISTPVGGSLSAGAYQAIVLYESQDAVGNVYRSFGGFVGPATAAANDQFQVPVQNLAMTERRDVSIVMFRTLANGSVYYRDVVQPNDPNASANVTLSGTQSDTLLATRELLDLTLVPRNPCPSTDFVAAVGGRFVTRDPERGSLVRFSTSRSEGFAPWWSFQQGLEAPTQRDVTAVGDLDGRVVLFTASDVSVAEGDGPDVSGNGGFRGPDRVPSEIGALAQPTLSEIPQGLVFGSSAGPRVLNRGLETQELAEQVYRYFEFDGYVVTRTLYVPEQATLIIAARRAVGDELVLRLHVQTGRWGEDTERPILDMASSRAGVVAYLGSDGRLLVEGDAALVRYQNLLALRSLVGRYPAYLFNGTLTELVGGVELALEGGAFLSQDLTTLGVFNRQSYESAGTDGDAVAVQDAAVGDLGVGASLALLWSQSLDANPAVLRGLLGKYTTLGADPNTGWRVLAAVAGPTLTIDPTGGVEPSTSVALTAASYGAGARRWFAAVVDFEAGVIRLGSDVEAEVSATIAATPGSSYATAAALRILDVQDDATPPVDGRVHWLALFSGSDLATFVPDCNALAQALRAADVEAVGVAAIAALADRTDGDQSYVTSVSTPWLREPTRDGTTHPGFTFQGVSIFGAYLGSHALRIQVFYDFVETPELDITIPRSQIDDEALQGRPYIYRVEQQDRRCYAVRVRFADTGEPNPTFRAEGIDVYYTSDGARVVELPTANIARSTT